MRFFASGDEPKVLVFGSGDSGNNGFTSYMRYLHPVSSLQFGQERAKNPSKAMVKRKRSHRILNLGSYARKRSKRTSTTTGQADPSPDPSYFAPSPPAHSPLNEQSDREESTHPSDTETIQDAESKDELGPSTEGTFLQFKSKLEEGMKQYVAQLSMRSRSGKYNKLNSRKRTTLQSREKKTASSRAAARASGYPPIYTLFRRASADSSAALRDGEIIVETSGQEARIAPVEEGAVGTPPKTSILSAVAGAEVRGGWVEVGSDGLECDLAEGGSDFGTEYWEIPTADWEENPLGQLDVNPWAAEPGIPAGEAENVPKDGSTGLEGVDKQSDGAAMQMAATVGGGPGARAGGPAMAVAAATIPLPDGEPLAAKVPALKKGSVELDRAVVELEAVARKKALNLRLRARVLVMLAFLRYYKSTSMQKSWIEASELAAVGAGKGPYLGRQLRSWVTQYAASKTLPLIPPVQFERSMIEDEDLKNDIKMHLQAQGKWVKAAHIVQFFEQEETKQKYGLTKAISERSARRWMHEMAYRYGTERKGQYEDGHEREDVVEYRNEVFLKRWDELESRMLLHNGKGGVVQTPQLPNFPRTLRVEQVAHDESTFYAHDQRKIRWIPEGESPTPAKKGDGVSIMVSDFCSPSLGWLRSPDCSREARVLFRAGKNRDGWFDSEDILQQTDLAIDLFEENFPLGHVIGLFCFDNAPSHQKRAPDALSARRMPKGTKFWPQKVPDNYVQMRPGKLPNGTPQEFWYPDDHPNPALAGKFKGMKIILQERGKWPNTIPELKAECDGFNCPPGRTDCCTRRLLWSQPDFANQKCALQELVETRGHMILFYPKYHCELNFIEQCWGKAKYEYRMYSMPKTEAELEQNVRMALDSVTLAMMQRFANRSARFIDAYRKGLSGAEAAWANKKYRGHRVLPHKVLSEIQNGM